MSPLFQAVCEGENPTLETLINELQNHIPRLSEFREIAHNFGETLFDHTELVLEKTYTLLEELTLAPEQRLTLVLAATLHDIGKTFTTRVVQDRIVAPEHAERGRSYLAYRLVGADLPYRVIHPILALVDHHHSIGKTVQAASQGKFWQLASEVDVALLYSLARANLAARSDIDTEKGLENLELFKLFAQEYGVWESPNPYLAWEQELLLQFPDQPAWIELAMGNIRREYGLGLIHSLEEGIARNYRYQDGFADFVIFFGPEGAKQERWIKTHLPEHKRVSFSDLQQEIAKGRSGQRVTGQVLQAAREQIKTHLHQHHAVIWDANNLMADLRDGWVQLGIRYGARVTMVVFQPALSELQKAAPDLRLLERQLEMLEFPSITEAHRTVFVGNKGLEMARFGFVASESA